MTIPSLPTLSLSIAFNPSDIFSATQTWTDCAAYVRSFTTQRGRQHYLDRMEAGTIRVTVDGRDGFFVNGTTNGTGYVLTPRLPIKVVETWSATDYAVFYGLIDSVTEVVTDQVNVDFTIQASDFLKHLSLKYLTDVGLYSTYANSASATNWYRCDLDPASTYTLVDEIGSNNATYQKDVGGVMTNEQSAVAFPTYGALIYDTDTCADLANGSTSAVGIIRLPQTSFTGMDMWYLGTGNQDKIICSGLYTTSGGSYIADLMVHGNSIQVASTPSGGGSTTYVAATGYIVNDGFWHHVGWYVDTGVLYVYQDGASSSVATLDASYEFISANSPGAAIGGDESSFPNLVAQIDEVVISGEGGSGYPSVSLTEFQNRYVAGSLLQLEKLSSDRIAEVLVIAGFGTITSGAISLPTGLFYVDGSAYSPGTQGFCSTEPYYWDTPTITSTALDVIFQVTATDVGYFFAGPDGTFQQFTQAHYGSWSWTAPSGSTPGSGTWTPSYTPPSGAHVWTDDDSGRPYEPATLQVVRDDADIWTQVKVTPQAGTDQVYEDAAAEARWGFSTFTLSGTVPTSLTDTGSALSTANYVGYLYRSPLPRVANVDLSSTAVVSGTVGYNMTAILGTRLGDPVTFKRTSPNASTSGTYPSTKGQIDTDMIVESVSLAFEAEPGTLVLSAVLDPYPLRS